jgi:anthranilate/para-aminobenzoate synthase component II
MRTPSHAELIASMYADPEDPEFQATGLQRPPLELLARNFYVGVVYAHQGLVEAYGAEIHRLTFPHNDPKSPLTTTAGLWRVH